MIDCRSVLERNGGVDYILIDSRAGFHDMAGVVTAQIPHGVVLFGKDSFQSWYGIRQAVHTISESQADKPAIMLVDSGCGKDEIVSAEEKESFLSHSYTIFTAVKSNLHFMQKTKPIRQFMFLIHPYSLAIFLYTIRIGQKFFKQNLQNRPIKQSHRD